MPDLKTILYRGGVITFDIPATWKEEYEPQGGGTFYEAGDDTGTLRLNVLTFMSPPGRLRANGYEHASSQPLADGERLSKSEAGDGIKYLRKSTKENGTSIDLYSWQVIHPAPPEKLYIALFAWTLLTEQRGIKKYLQEIEMLDGLISRAVFHPDLGKI